MRAFGEDEPDDRIREHLAAIWPAFRRWWREGANTRPAAGLWQSAAAGVNLPLLAVWLLVEGAAEAPEPRFGATLVELPDTIPYRPPW